MKTIIELLLLVVLCSDFVISVENKENKLHESHHHKAQGSRKHIGVKHSNHVKTRAFSVQRCFVICPVDVACFGGGIHNVVTPASSTTKLPATTTSFTTEESTEEPENTSLSGNSTTPSARKGSKKTKLKHGFHSHNLINFNHPSLNRVWKRKLIEKLKTSNTRTKQSYKFRQFTPNNCYVVCNSAPQYPPVMPAAENLIPEQPDETVEEDPNDSDDDDDDGDDPYKQGEDSPIEATMSPPDDKRSSHVKNKKNNVHKGNKL